MHIRNDAAGNVDVFALSRQGHITARHLHRAVIGLRAQGGDIAIEHDILRVVQLTNGQAIECCADLRAIQGVGVGKAVRHGLDLQVPLPSVGTGVQRWRIVLNAQLACINVGDAGVGISGRQGQHARTLLGQRAGTTDHTAKRLRCAGVKHQRCIVDNATAVACRRRTTE